MKKPFYRMDFEAPGENRELGFAVGVAVTFAVIVGIGLWHHELWRDEWQAWLIARDSGSLADLLHNTRNEGHPAPYYVVLWSLANLGGGVRAFQALHGAIAVAGVFVFARYMPLSRLYRLLFVAGYFVAYEYAVVARQYGIALLGVAILGFLLSTKRRHPLLLALPLLAIAVTSVYGVIVALAVAAGLWFENWRALPKKARGRWVLGAFTILVLGTLLALPRIPHFGFTLRPAGASGSLQWGVSQTLAHVWRAYAPIARMSDGMALWDQNILRLDSAVPLVVGPFLAGLLVFGVILGLSRRPAALLTYLIGTTGYLLFSYIWHSGGLRHHGHLYMILIVSIWLAHVTPGVSTMVGPMKSSRRWVERRFGWLVGLFLVLQLPGTFVFYRSDLRGPFSDAPEVAEFIRNFRSPSDIVASTNAPRGSSVAGSLGEPIYYLRGRWLGTWTDWEPPNDRPVRTQLELLEPLEELISPDGRALVVSVNRLGAAVRQRWDIEEVLRTETAMVPSERYRLYAVSRKVQGTDGSSSGP